MDIKLREDEKDLNCPHCDFICESPTVLTKHMKSRCFKFKCPACSFKTSRRLKFIEHEPRKCKMDNNPENPGHAACDKCDYRANTFAQLKIHIQNERCYKMICKYCPFQTSVTKKYTEHRVYRTCRTKTRPDQVKYKITNGPTKGRYPCTLCDYKGNSFANLQYHQQTKICYRHNCQHCVYY